MSIWTHVVSAIRVDGIPDVLGSNIEDVKKVMGTIVTFYSPEDIESDIPQGSEGSLQYRVIQYSDGFPWVVIPIWGDLRNYDDTDEITEWFHKKCKQLGHIRDAVITMYVEGQEPITITYKQEKYDE